MQTSAAAFIAGERQMKTDIHPEYMECNVRCACGNEFTTRSTREEIRVDVCGECHPFYTGQQKIVDTEGRIDKFIKRYGLQDRYKDFDKEEAAEAVEEAEEARAEADRQAQIERQEELEQAEEEEAEAEETDEDAE
jgi:large subunit ribosomal protein L31